jgi:hypothetical protein
MKNEVDDGNFAGVGRGGGRFNGEMGFDVEAVPIQEFTPLAVGDGKDTDLEDIVFPVNRGLVSLPYVEQIVKDIMPQVRKFDISPKELRSRLQTVRDML